MPIIYRAPRSNRCQERKCLEELLTIDRISSNKNTIFQCSNCKSYWICGPSSIWYPISTWYAKKRLKKLGIT